MMTASTWVPVHHGRTMTLFVRQDRAGQVTGTMDQLRALPDLAWMRAWYNRVLGEPTTRGRLHEQVRRLRREVPKSPALRLVEAVLMSDHPRFYFELNRPPTPPTSR